MSIRAALRLTVAPHSTVAKLLWVYLFPLLSNRRYNTNRGCLTLAVVDKLASDRHAELAPTASLVPDSEIAPSKLARSRCKSFSIYLYYKRRFANCK
jgi:hypothetical protein